MGKIIVIGAGFSGSVIARKIAEELNRPVQIVEKRQHIAGNMFDEADEHGILVQRYGPHVLVTNYWRIVDYLSRFAKMIPYTVKELSCIDGRYVRLPFNFESIQQLIGPEQAEYLIGKLREIYPARDRVPVGELVNSDDSRVADFGMLLFEKAYRTYCAKQWGIPINQLDKSIMERVPIAISYDERYMNRDFQYIPEEGFTSLFETMLKHPNINVRTGEDALEHISFNAESKTVEYDGEEIDALVFTGAIDELFSGKYGELPYRSLQFKYEWFNCDRKFPEAIISFPQAEGYTRKTEYRYLTCNANPQGTIVATEYPTSYIRESNVPFYPVITAQTKERHERYCAEASQYSNLFYCGRLADFRYFNMDECIIHAMDTFDKLRTLLQ